MRIAVCVLALVGGCVCGIAGLIWRSAADPSDEAYAVQGIELHGKQHYDPKWVVEVTTKYRVTIRIYSALLAVTPVAVLAGLLALCCGRWWPGFMLALASAGPVLVTVPMARFTVGPLIGVSIIVCPLALAACLSFSSRWSWDRKQRKSPPYRGREVLNWP